MDAADLDLTPAHVAARDWARTVADGLPVDEYGWDEEARYPAESVEALAASGMLGLTLPKEDGGQGADRLTSVVVQEQLAYRSLTLAEVAQIALNGPPYAISRLGSKSLRKRLLPGVLAGTTLVTIAITEEDAGSSLADVATSFERDGDTVVVEGTKCFVTAGGLAGAHLVLGRFAGGPGPGLSGLGYVLVDGATPGVTVERSWHKIGGNAIPEAVVRFDRCVVPADCVVVEGFKPAMQSYNTMRLGIAAMCVGAGQAVLDHVVAHLESRHQFGQPLADFQGLRWRVTELALALEQARLLTYRAARLADRDEHRFPPAREAAAAKLLASRTAVQLAEQAVQLQGWRGMVRDREHPAELWYRQLRGWTIAGGTTESLLNALSSSLFTGGRA
ncbi:MAG TPA: acyl-CoA dehydrogenase family protein [Acidimicrobiales bacterium]|nr:acyl-CoA dehydrogenase family protein [Acidimicrobiales bacterium]